MNRKLMLFLIFVLLVLCFFGSYFYVMKQINSTKIEDNIVRPSILTQKEKNVYDMFGSGNTALYDFKYVNKKNYEVWLTVEELKDNKWEQITGMSCKLDSEEGKILIDYRFREGGRFSVGNYDKKNNYNICHGSFYPEHKINNEINLSISNIGDLVIKDNEPLVLQLLMNGKKSDPSLLDEYSNPEKFSNYKNVVAITVSFKK